MQTFIINSSLLSKIAFPDEEVVFIDVQSRKAAQPDEETLQTLSAVFDHLKVFSETSVEGKVVCSLDIMDFAPSVLTSHQDKLAWARSTMITLCGILLEYPYIYYTPTKSIPSKQEESLNNVSLCISETVLHSAKHDADLSIIQFSVPQEEKTAAPDNFAKLLERCRDKYAARICGSKYPEMREYQIEIHIKDNVMLQNVAL